jgi:hypothetical protein
VDSGGSGLGCCVGVSVEGRRKPAGRRASEAGV